MCPGSKHVDKYLPRRYAKTFKSRVLQVMKMKESDYKGHMQVFNKCWEMRCQEFCSSHSGNVGGCSLLAYYVACIQVSVSKYQYADLPI